MSNVRHDKRNDLRVNRTIQAVLDLGLEALGEEMQRIRDAACGTDEKKGRPLIDREQEKLCNYVRATCIMAREERENLKNPLPGSEDLVDRIADALKDPQLFAQVQARMGQAGRTS